jgi:hypothetical protein
MPSRRERKTLRLREPSVVRHRGKKSERGEERWRRPFFRLDGEKAREVRKLRRAGDPDPN